MFDMLAMYPLVIVVVLVVMFLASAIRILNEYERGVIFRLGRVIATKGPGLIILIPIVDKMVKIDMRTITMDVPPQDVITRDNVSIKVNAVVYFRVIDANAAVIDVENYLYATSQLSQTTLRSVCGQMELDEILSEREKINLRLQEILDRNTEPWGIKGLPRRGQADRPSRGDETGDGQTGRGRAGAAGQGHQCGRRVPGRPEADRGGGAHGDATDVAAAPLSPDPEPDRLGEQLHDDLPDPDRPVQAVPETGGEGIKHENGLTN